MYGLQEGNCVSRGGVNVVLSTDNSEREAIPSFGALDVTSRVTICIFPGPSSSSSGSYSVTFTFNTACHKACLIPHAMFDYLSFSLKFFHFVTHSDFYQKQPFPGNRHRIISPMCVNQRFIGSGSSVTYSKKKRTDSFCFVCLFLRRTLKSNLPLNYHHHHFLTRRASENIPIPNQGRTKPQNEIVFTKNRKLPPLLCLSTLSLFCSLHLRPEKVWSRLAGPPVSWSI